MRPPSPNPHRLASTRATFSSTPSRVSVRHFTMRPTRPWRLPTVSTRSPRRFARFPPKYRPTFLRVALAARPVGQWRHPIAGYISNPP
eukprot:scaffold98987_cov29-Tisochrysis_lutea.AAC.7